MLSFQIKEKQFTLLKTISTYSNFNKKYFKSEVYQREGYICNHLCICKSMKYVLHAFN